MTSFISVLLDIVVKRVPEVRGAQDRAAARQDPGDRFDGQRNGAFRPDQPVEAVVDADDSPAVSQDGGANRAANDGVETWAISAPVGDADSLNCWSHKSSIMRQATGPEAQADILHYPPKDLAEYGYLPVDRSKQLNSCVVSRQVNITGCPKNCNPGISRARIRNRSHPTLWGW